MYITGNPSKQSGVGWGAANVQRVALPGRREPGLHRLRIGAGLSGGVLTLQLSANAGAPGLQLRGRQRALLQQTLGVAVQDAWVRAHPGVRQGQPRVRAVLLIVAVPAPSPSLSTAHMGMQVGYYGLQPQRWLSYHFHS